MCSSFRTTATSHTTVGESQIANETKLIGKGGETSPSVSVAPKRAAKSKHPEKESTVDGRLSRRFHTSSAVKGGEAKGGADEKNAKSKVKTPGAGGLKALIDKISIIKDAVARVSRAPVAAVLAGQEVVSFLASCTKVCTFSLVTAAITAIHGIIDVARNATSNAGNTRSVAREVSNGGIKSKKSAKNAANIGILGRTLKKIAANWDAIAHVLKITGSIALFIGVAVACIAACVATCGLAAPIAIPTVICSVFSMVKVGCSETAAIVELITKQVERENLNGTGNQPSKGLWARARRALAKHGKGITLGAKTIGAVAAVIGGATTCVVACMATCGFAAPIVIPEIVQISLSIADSVSSWTKATAHGKQETDKQDNIAQNAASA